MESYSAAATLGYAINRRVVVFGDGSFHGRQDDFDTDFRQLDGRDFLIPRKETVSPSGTRPSSNVSRSPASTSRVSPSTPSWHRASATPCIMNAC